jgi:hypothetical protein
MRAVQSKRRRQSGEGNKMRKLPLAALAMLATTAPTNAQQNTAKTWYIYLVAEARCEAGAVQARKAPILASPDAAIRYMRSTEEYCGQQVMRDNDSNIDRVDVEAP